MRILVLDEHRHLRPPPIPDMGRLRLHHPYLHLHHDIRIRCIGFVEERCRVTHRELERETVPKEELPPQ